jgi:hypothetical protein
MVKIKEQNSQHAYFQVAKGSAAPTHLLTRPYPLGNGVDLQHFGEGQQAPEIIHIRPVIRIE